MLGPEVSDNNLPDNKQLHDGSSGVRGQPDQDGPGQDQGPVPHDQHSSGAAHQGYRGAGQGGQEGRSIIIVINIHLSSSVQVQDLLEKIKDENETEGKGSK